MIIKQQNVTEKAMALLSLRFESGDEVRWVVVDKCVVAGWWVGWWVG